MRDLDLAKEILEVEDMKLVLVNNGQVVYKSTDRGIRPMYDLVKGYRKDSIGGSIADRVIGKGAAILAVDLKIASLYTDLISQSGVDILEANEIEVFYNRICPYIKNRDKTDYCPIEKLSQTTQDPDELIIRIEEFFNNIK